MLKRKQRSSGGYTRIWPCMVGIAGMSSAMLLTLEARPVAAQASVPQEAPAPNILEMLESSLTAIVRATRPAVVSIEGRVRDIDIFVPNIPKPAPLPRAPRIKDKKDEASQNENRSAAEAAAADEAADAVMFLENRQQRIQMAIGAPVVGTGFLVQGGFVVTTAEVVDGVQKPVVVLADGRRIESEWVNTDKRSNLAVLKIPGLDSWPGLRWGDPGRVAPGSLSLMIGNQAGYPNSVTLGLISGTGRSGRSGSQHYTNLIQFQGAIGQGCSGGPLLNVRGEVIGIVVATPATTSIPRYLTPGPEGKRIGLHTDDALETAGNTPVGATFTIASVLPIAGIANTGFALTVSDARPVIEALCKRQQPKFQQGWLGVRLGDPDAAARGLVIEAIYGGGPADKAGLRPGDILLSIHGRPVSANWRLNLPKLNAGDVFEMEILRGEERKTITITIEPRPDDATIKKMPIRTIPMETSTQPIRCAA